jgi:hypothetical protein
MNQIQEIVIGKSELKSFYIATFSPFSDIVARNMKENQLK